VEAIFRAILVKQSTGTGSLSFLFGVSVGDSMKRIAVALLLASSPVLADTISGVSNPLPDGVRDPNAWDGTIRCKPIGKTLSGELVFEVDCKDVPTGTTVKGQPPAAPLSGVVKDK
jgi:hypothetical protein